jgi:hypothetical protein
VSGLERCYLTALAFALLIRLMPVVGLTLFALGMAALLAAARVKRGHSGP